MKMALKTVLVLGSFLMSACSDVKKDQEIPSGLSSNLSAGGEIGPDHDLGVIVGFAQAHMTQADIDAGTFQLRKDGDVWTFQSPIDWAADPFDDLNWRLELNKLVMIDPYLTAFEKTGDRLAFQKAVNIVLDWQDFHQTNAQTTSVSWLDMVAGQRATRLAYIISEAELNPELISSAHLSNLISLADFHVQRMKGPGFMPDDNHGIFDALGVAALCATLDALSACPEAKSKAQRRMREIFFLQFAEDGGHKEHSPLYHYFAFNAFSNAFESGLFDGDPEMMARKEKALALRPWFLDGTGKTPAIGDSERQVAYVGPGLSCEGDEVTCTKAAFLPKSGYGIVRTVSDNPNKRASLTATCSFHSYIHKHLDELSFEWVEQGQHILVDSGKYSYDNDSTRQFMLSRRAHNTVEYRDERFSMDKASFPGACLKSMTQKNGVVSISGEYDVPGTRRRHKRDITYTPGKSVRVKDYLDGPAESVVKQYWHFAPGFKRQPDKGMTLVSGDMTVKVSLPGGCVSQTVEGVDGREPQGWVATGYRKREAAPVVVISCLPGTREIETRLDITNATATGRDISITTF